MSNATENSLTRSVETSVADKILGPTEASLEMIAGDSMSTSGR
jgi:hypothetical protein